LGLTAWGEEQLRAAEERFTFVAMGCMPYGDDNFAAYERLLAEINRQQPAFTVHCGDTKGGGVPPTEAFLKHVHGWFDSLEGAAIYTPGDNEWTDVHRASNGSQDPAVWLAKVRAEYFSAERSMGRAPIPLVTQRRERGFEKFVENARWTRGGVVFATVHVVGSNNNNSPEIPGAVAEFRGVCGLRPVRGRMEGSAHPPERRSVPLTAFPPVRLSNTRAGPGPAGTRGL
jgi:hypothetical protein